MRLLKGHFSGNIFREGLHLGGLKQLETDNHAAWFAYTHMNVANDLQRFAFVSL